MLGDAVTPEIAAAWDEVYWLFATQLVAQEARLYQQAGVDPAHPVRPYRVVRRIEETDDVVSLVLEPTDGGGLPQIGPGQYVSVFVDLPDGRRQPRQYTVSSTAVATRLQITVLRVHGVDGAPDGMVSSFLHDHVAVGDVLDVSAPAGDFVVQTSGGPLLLASAGAGITTVLPIVEHIARTQPQRKVIVAHADRAAEDHALRETVLHVGRQIDDFSAYTWYESVDPADHRSARATWTSRRCRWRTTFRSSRAGRCRSCGTCGPACSRVGCRRPPSGTRCSARICGRPRTDSPQPRVRRTAAHRGGVDPRGDQGVTGRSRRVPSTTTSTRSSKKATSPDTSAASRSGAG